MVKVKSSRLFLLSVFIVIVSALLLSIPRDGQDRTIQLVTLRDNVEELSRLYSRVPIRDDERIQLTASLRYIQLHTENKPLYAELPAYAERLNAYLAAEKNEGSNMERNWDKDIRHICTMFQNRAYSGLHADQDQSYFMKDSERYRHINDVVEELKEVNWGALLDRSSAIETFASLELLSNLLTQEKLDDSQIQRLTTAVSDEMSVWLSPDIDDKGKKACQWTMKSYLYEIASRIEVRE